MRLRFDHPQMLWLLLLAIPIVMLGWRSLAVSDATKRCTVIAIRLACLLLLVGMLAGLQAVQRHNSLTVMAVLDRSESIRRLAEPPMAGVAVEEPEVTIAGVPETAETWTRRWLRQVSGKHRPDDRLGIITYDARPTIEVLPTNRFDTDPDIVDQPREGTDSAAAIRLAMALFPPDTSKRMVLVSDGNDTTSADSRSSDSVQFGNGVVPGLERDRGDLLAAAREAGAAGIPIDVLPIEYKVQNEVIVDSLHTPAEARIGQTVPLRVVLRATYRAAGRLQLRHGSQWVDLNGAVRGTGQPIHPDDWIVESAPESNAAGGNDTGQHSTGYLLIRKLDLPLSYPGANEFEAVIEPTHTSQPNLTARQDTIAANNRAQSFTLVHGRGRILFVDEVGADGGRILPDTLRTHGIDLDLVPGHALPASLSEFQPYDAVVLQNVPAESISPVQQQLLAQYVGELGGGLVMIGGPDSFGPGGWANTPVDDVLPVLCELPYETVLPSGALVLVRGGSGSMASVVPSAGFTKQDVANEAAILALSTLYPQDLVGVIAFDNRSEWVVQLSPNTQPRLVADQVRAIQPSGGTNIHPALVLAHRALAQLETQEAAVKHVVLLTDGQSQGGDFHTTAEKMAADGITLSTIGVGGDVNGELLSDLARIGGGQYHPITDTNHLPQIFIKEARTIRKNLIKEHPFEPGLVNTGSTIMAGIRSTPALNGFVVTGVKQDPRVYMPIVGPEGKPIFAHWQVGLGRVAAFTSDATNRWASPWLTWPGYPDFWTRTIRAIARPPASRDYDLMTTTRGETLHIRLDTAASPSNPRVSSSHPFHVIGSVLDPKGDTMRIQLDQTSPGIYEATSPALQAGNYIVSLVIQEPSAAEQLSENQPRSTLVFGGVTRPHQPEWRNLQSNRRVLEQVAEITGGRVLDAATTTPDLLFKRESITPTRTIRPMWRALLTWLLGLFLVDVASRRIAWSGPGIAAAARSAVLGVTGRHTRLPEGAPATLRALKRRAKQVEDRLTPKEHSRQGPTEPSMPQGSSRPPAPTMTDERAIENPSTKPEPDTTIASRLLAAKHRARSQMDRQSVDQQTPSPENRDNVDEETST